MMNCKGINFSSKKRMLMAAMVGMFLVGTPAKAQHYNPETAPLLNLEEARRLVDEGHFYGASKSLKAFEKNNPDLSSSELGEVEGLLLVCDYYLKTPGTADKIAEWAKNHPQHSMSERLQLLRSHLLVEEGKYADALEIMNSDLSDSNLGQRDSEENRLCRAIALINAEESIPVGERNYQIATELLQTLHDSKSHQMDIVYYEGYIKYAEGRYAEALEDFLLVSKNSDYEKNMPVYMADCYLHTGEPLKSLALLNNQLPIFNTQLSQIDAKYADEIHRIRGEAYYDTKNYTKAIEALGQYCYNVESPKRSALYKLGMSYFNIQEYQKAAPELSRSASVATDEMAQNAWLNAGISYIYSQNKKQAQIAFQQASEMNANAKYQEEALYNYALTLHEGNTMGFGESVNVFERFLNTFPNSQYASSVSKHLSEVYFSTKNYPAALASINKIKNPSKEILSAKQKILYNLGIQEFIAGNYKSSDSYTAQAIQLGSKEAYYLKGESEYRQGQYANAITDLRTFINGNSSTNANYNQALYTLGYAYFKQKQYGQAKTYFNSFVGRQGIQSKVKADALNRLADCQFVDRQYDEAYATYQRAIDTDKSLGDYSLYQQAFINGLKGNYDKKVEQLNQIGGEYAESEFGADALYEQGRAYLQTGAKQKAVETFASLINKFPHSQQARKAGNEMAMVYQEAGQTDVAIQSYLRVIDSYPNTHEAQVALDNLKAIYTQQGRVNDYVALAQKAGKSLSGDELDEMVANAANRSMNEGKYAEAYKYYSQLAQQTSSAGVQQNAYEGRLRSAFNAKDYEEVVSVANQMIMASKTSPELKAEAQLFRAESYLALGHAAEGVKDLQQLTDDHQTMYGAQATVRLAQYGYDTNQYVAAEQILQKFIDSGTTHQYWLARAFILLSDVYMKTDRQVEAKEYLLSLKSNYSGNEEINNMIKERLEK